MDSYMMALTREIHRLFKDNVSHGTAEHYATLIVLYDRLVSIEAKMDKLSELLTADKLSEKEDESQR